MCIFAQHYPHLARWLDNQGYIELGSDDDSYSQLRILDAGGLCFEDEESQTIEEALAAGEQFLVGELAERFGLSRNPKTGEFRRL